MRFGNRGDRVSDPLARAFGRVGPVRVTGTDQLMRAAIQAINMLWVVALASLRSGLSDFIPGQLPASVFSFGGLAVISIAAHQLRGQLTRDAWLVGRWATLSGGARETWLRLRAAAHAVQTWPRACPPEPGLMLASIAVAGAALFRLRLRAPEAAAAMAERIQRLLRHAPFDIEALRRWLFDWLPGWNPASGLRHEVVASACRPGSSCFHPTLFAPVTLPQRC